VDIDRSCPSRVLENQPNQSVGAECRCSLAGVIYVTRLFAGAYFLVLCQRGQLPCGFATPAGWSDIVVAVLALAVVGAMRTQIAKKLFLSWNTIGLIDIIFVVFSALRFGLKDWQSMHAL
jgi:hypothetical protein